MGFLSKLKQIFQYGMEKESHSKIIPPKIAPSKIPYFEPANPLRFQKIAEIPLVLESTAPTWDDFFILAKPNPNLIGFTQRSRRKFRHLYHDHEMIIAQAGNTLEIVRKDQIFAIPLNAEHFETLHAEAAHRNGVIFTNKDTVSFVHFGTLKAFLYRFEWQPFRVAIGSHFFLVGIRETYDGPGELYCFHLDGTLKWAISFKEQMTHVFGAFSFFPYHLSVSADSTDIFVSSMDRLYRLDTEGNLQARISISELKEKELSEKQMKFVPTFLSQKTQTKEEVLGLAAEQIASDLYLNLERITMTEPFSGFAHDPETDSLFILERKGRLTAWDEKGKLKWAVPFQNEGYFIRWTGEKITVSLTSGDTFFLDRNGTNIHTVKLPKEATDVLSVPNENKYLIISKDNRMYEFDEETKTLIPGPEGHPGMELFEISGQLVFFDGTSHKQGYFWLAPPHHRWKIAEAKTFLEKEANEGGMAPEITAFQDFPKLWELKSGENRWVNQTVDLKQKRIYISEDIPLDADRLDKIYERNWEKEYLRHNLVCYDFKGTVLWKKSFYSSMLHLYVSPDGENIFTSVPLKDEITYLPGHLVILSKDGNIIQKIEIDAQGFLMDFLSNEKALVHFRTEKSDDPKREGILEKNEKGKWVLTFPENQEDENPFGPGLNYIQLPHFTLKRFDKKQYAAITKPKKGKRKELHLKLSGAIYEAHETDGHLIIRSGNRTISVYDTSLEKIAEIKEGANIIQVLPGNNTIAVLTKTELKGYTKDGTLKWRYGSLPKTTSVKLYWLQDAQIYIWTPSNSVGTMVSAITEEGEVVRSQYFDSIEYNRSKKVYPEEKCFVAQSNQFIRCFSLV